MILDTLYCFEKNEDSRSKTRLDLKAFTERYEPLHKEGRHGDVFIYNYGIPDAVKAHSKRLGDTQITNGDGYISALFFPEIENPNQAYGDIKNTEDAILVHFKHGKKQMEIYVSKGKKNCVHNLYHLWLDGQLDQEIENLKKKADNNNMP